MKRTNKAALQLITTLGSYNRPVIVAALVEAGFIEADELSRPEQYAQAARDWVVRYNNQDAKTVLNRAAGWSTEAWEVVIADTTDIRKRQDIFLALKILEKEVIE